MAFSPRAGCRCCDLILQQAGGDRSKIKKSDLYRLVEQSQQGAMQMLTIAKKYENEISYPSIRNHSKNHQAISESQLVKAKVKKSTRMVKREIADAELELTKKKLHHTERREKFLDWLMDEMAKGTIKPTASAIAAGLKQEADIESKQTDQGIEMAKLMNSYIAMPLPPQATDHIEGEVIE